MSEQRDRRRRIRWHHNYAVTHRAEAKVQKVKEAHGAQLTPTAIGDLRRWMNAPAMPKNLHELTANLHELAAWLLKNEYCTAGRTIGEVANLLTVKLGSEEIRWER